MLENVSPNLERARREFLNWVKRETLYAHCCQECGASVRLRAKYCNECGAAEPAQVSTLASLALLGAILVGVGFLIILF